MPSFAVCSFLILQFIAFFNVKSQFTQTDCLDPTFLNVTDLTKYYLSGTLAIRDEGVRTATIRIGYDTSSHLLYVLYNTSYLDVWSGIALNNRELNNSLSIIYINPDTVLLRYLNENSVVGNYSQINNLTILNDALTAGPLRQVCLSIPYNETLIIGALNNSINLPLTMMIGSSQTFDINAARTQTPINNMDLIQFSEVTDTVITFNPTPTPTMQPSVTGAYWSTMDNITSDIRLEHDIFFDEKYMVVRAYLSPSVSWFGYGILDMLGNSDEAEIVIVSLQNETINYRILNTVTTALSDILEDNDFNITLVRLERSKNNTLVVEFEKHLSDEELSMLFDDHTSCFNYTYAWSSQEDFTPVTNAVWEEDRLCFELATFAPTPSTDAPTSITSPPTHTPYTIDYNTWYSYNNIQVCDNATYSNITFNVWLYENTSTMILNYNYDTRKFGFWHYVGLFSNVTENTEALVLYNDGTYEFRILDDQGQDVILNDTRWNLINNTVRGNNRHLEFSITLTDEQLWQIFSPDINRSPEDNNITFYGFNTLFGIGNATEFCSEVHFIHLFPWTSGYIPTPAPTNVPTYSPIELDYPSYYSCNVGTLFNDNSSINMNSSIRVMFYPTNETLFINYSFPDDSNWRGFSLFVNENETNNSNVIVFNKDNDINNNDLFVLRYNLLQPEIILLDNFANNMYYVMNDESINGTRYVMLNVTLEGEQIHEIIKNRTITNDNNDDDDDEFEYYGFPLYFIMGSDDDSDNSINIEPAFIQLCPFSEEFIPTSEPTLSPTFSPLEFNVRRYFSWNELDDNITLDVSFYPQDEYMEVNHTVPVGDYCRGIGFFNNQIINTTALIFYNTTEDDNEFLHEIRILNNENDIGMTLNESNYHLMNDEIRNDTRYLSFNVTLDPVTLHEIYNSIENNTNNISRCFDLWVVLGTCSNFELTNIVVCPFVENFLPSTSPTSEPTTQPSISPTETLELPYGIWFSYNTFNGFDEEDNNVTIDLILYAMNNTMIINYIFDDDDAYCYNLALIDDEIINTESIFLLNNNTYEVRLLTSATDLGTITNNNNTHFNIIKDETVNGRRNVTINATIDDEDLRNIFNKNSNDESRDDDLQWYGMWLIYGKCIDETAINYRARFVELLPGILFPTTSPTAAPTNTPSMSPTMDPIYIYYEGNVTLNDTLGAVLGLRFDLLNDLIYVDYWINNDFPHWTAIGLEDCSILDTGNFIIFYPTTNITNFNNTNMTDIIQYRYMSPFNNGTIIDNEFNNFTIENMFDNDSEEDNRKISFIMPLDEDLKRNYFITYPEHVPFVVIWDKGDDDEINFRHPNNRQLFIVDLYGIETETLAPALMPALAPFNDYNLQPFSGPTLKPISDFDYNCSNNTYASLNFEKYGFNYSISFNVSCEDGTVTFTGEVPDDKWFGMIFNDEMITPGRVALIYTTGIKENVTQVIDNTVTRRLLQSDDEDDDEITNCGRDAALYSYWLLGYRVKEIIYAGRERWTEIRNEVVDGVTYLKYRQELEEVPYILGVDELPIRFAIGNDTCLSAGGYYSDLYYFDWAAGAIVLDPNWERDDDDDDDGNEIDVPSSKDIKEDCGDDDYIISHIALMWAAFVVIIPIGIFVSILRYCCTNSRVWLYIHVGFMIFGLLCILAGFAMGITAIEKNDDKHFNNVHNIFGLIIVIFAFIQPCIGIAIPNKQKYATHPADRTSCRLPIVCCHILNGILFVWIAGLINAAIGFFEYCSDALGILHAVIAGILVLLWLLATFCGLCAKCCYADRENDRKTYHYRDGSHSSSDSHGRRKKKIVHKKRTIYSGDNGTYDERANLKTRDEHAIEHSSSSNRRTVNYVPNNLGQHDNIKVVPQNNQRRDVEMV